MKFERILSLFLILLAITGSGADVTDSLIHEEPGATQLIENTGLGLHEFRETVKIRLRLSAPIKLNQDGCPPNQFLSSRAIQAAHHISFLQTRFEKSGSKLFIDLGTLLI